ncbi:MAG: response regulator [Desulforhopalus sp.]|nr:response regulator [Desulforhopalus sp.]
MNGYQTYKNIRELLPNQKALITSGFSESLDVKQAQKIGAGAYVKKPYTLMELAN